MIIDPIPIDKFVRDFLGKPEAAVVMQSWRVDPEKIVELLSREMRDFGFLFVSGPQVRILKRVIVDRLKSSKEIKRFVDAGAREEKKRSYIRHD